MALVAHRYLRPGDVLFARSRGPYRDSAPKAWRTLEAWLDRHALRPRIRQAFGYFRDDPRTTAPELVRFDACVPAATAADIELPPDIGRQTLPAGAYAVESFRGRYEDIGPVLSRLRRDMAPGRLSIDLGRAFLAVYLADPRVTPAAHRRCDICVPVLPVSMASAGNDADDLSAEEQAFPRWRRA